MTFHHRAFDKIIASSQRLRLLPEVAPASPDVTVTWSDEPLWVDPLPGLVNWHAVAEGYVVDLPASRMLVAVDPRGTRLVVHPNPREVDLADYGLPSIPPALRGARRLTADTLVTNVLTALPALWGRVTVHSAAMESDDGVVLVCARTGWGKSTTAAWLDRLGWRLLDDDSCTVEPTDGGLRLRPMGGRARLRQDAADDLGVRGESLPGYAGGKQAMDTGDATARERLAATIHLVQLPEHADAPVLEVKAVEQAQALVSLSRAMMIVDRRDQRARELRVRTAQLLSQAPAFAVVYRRDAVPAPTVAEAIMAAVGSSCRT